MKASMYNMELDIDPEPGMRIEQQGFDPLKTPYEVDDQVFPWYESLQEQFLFLIRYAVLAPSSHNTQPWKFQVTADGIAVYADYGRRLVWVCWFTSRNAVGGQKIDHEEHNINVDPRFCCVNLSNWNTNLQSDNT